MKYGKQSFNKAMSWITLGMVLSAVAVAVPSSSNPADQLELLPTPKTIKSICMEKASKEVSEDLFGPQRKSLLSEYETWGDTGGLWDFGAAGACLGGGGEIPIPYLIGRVELVDGETYLLLGKVIYHEGLYYYQINLRVHPWLASNLRVSSPYYVLMGAGLNWADYVNQSVKMRARVHWRFYTKQDGQIGYEIFLEPLEMPTLVDCPYL